MVGLCRVLAPLLFLLLAGTLHARPLALLPADAVVVAPGDLPLAASAIAKRASGSARDALLAGDEHAAWSALGPDADVLAFELAAAELIAELQAGVGGDGADRLLSRLAELAPRVFHRHDETAAHWYLPLLDVGARAKSALAMRERARQRESWHARFERDPNTALGALHAEQGRDGVIAAEAVPGLSAKAALQLFAAAKSAPQSTPSALWRALAQRFVSADAFALAAMHASDADLLALLPVSSALADADALRWLAQVGQRPALASAALMALAPRAAPDSLALARLLDTLEDPALGDSAAAALARRSAPDRVEVLVAAGRDASPAALVRIALALRLVATPEADRALAELRDDPRLPEPTRRELRR